MGKTRWALQGLAIQWLQWVQWVQSWRILTRKRWQVCRKMSLSSLSKILMPLRKELKWDQTAVDHIVGQWYSEQAGAYNAWSCLGHRDRNALSISCSTSTWHALSFATLLVVSSRNTMIIHVLDRKKAAWTLSRWCGLDHAQQASQWMPRPGKCKAPGFRHYDRFEQYLL